LQFAQHLDLLRTFELLPLETWRLGEPLRAAANSHFQQSFSGCGCGLASAALHHFPRKPSRAPTNAPINAPRMPKCPPLHPLPFVPPKNALAQSCSSGFYAAIFFPFNAALSKVFLNSASSVAI